MIQSSAYLDLQPSTNTTEPHIIMKSGKKLLLTVGILTILVVRGVLADTVILKNGREIQVEKTWYEGDQLCFVFHGMEAGIPQCKVSHIQRNSDDRNTTIPLKDTAKDDLNKTGPKSTQKAMRGRPEDQPPMDSTPFLAVVPTEPCVALRKDGFCDLQWGREAASVDGLEKKQTISELDNVVEYVRPTVPLTIGGAVLESVTYAFWRDQLYTVTVWTEGYSNFTAMRDAVIKEFGPGIRNDSTRDKYLWSDALSDIMLNYTEEGRYGMLWLRSREIDRLCKSSQLKGHASLLKWMRQRH
jgi:hypothetical protein